MAEKKTDWEIPADARPRPEDFTFDLDRALNAVLRLEATVPQDAFSAATLGTYSTSSLALASIGTKLASQHSHFL